MSPSFNPIRIWWIFAALALSTQQPPRFLFPPAKLFLVLLLFITPLAKTAAGFLLPIMAIAAVILSRHHNTGKKFADLPLAVVACTAFFQFMSDRLPKQGFDIPRPSSHLRIEGLTIHHGSLLVV